jgi:hypothetical protein
MITAPTQFSGLQVWLDGSDTTTLFQLSGGTTAVAANLDPVGYWGDKSGNNRHFTNIGGSATTRPTWVSSLSTVRFDGTNDYLSSFFNITYTAQTVFVVLKTNSHGTDGSVFTQAAAGVSDASTIKPCNLNSTAGQYSSYAGGGRQSGVSYRSTSLYDIFSYTHSGTTLRNFVISNANVGSTYAHTLNYTVVCSRMGANISNGTTGATGGFYFNGDISEVIVYNRALTNLERADVEYYLTRKWNFLNSIPRQVYGIKNGLWSLTDTWSVSAEPSPWNFPLSADNAYTNTFTVTANSSTKVDTIRNSALAPNIASGGSFVLANGVSLSANVVGSGAGSSTATLTLNSVATATLVGNLTGGSTTSAYGVANLTGGTLNVIGSTRGGSGANSIGVYNLANGILNIYGDCFGSLVGSAVAVNNVGSGTTNIFGNVTAGSNAISHGVYNETTGTITVNGNITGGSNATAYGANNASTGTITVNGNVTASTGNGLYNTSTGTIAVSGAVITSTATAAINNASTGTAMISGGPITASNLASAFVSSNTSAVNKIYASIINAPNGRQAIYAPRYQVFPTGSAQYTRQASNGYDSYVDYWTSNSTFSYPASSDVALGTTYSNSSLSGSMAVPSPSSVALGAPVGTTTGTASITLDNVLSQPIANLTTPNSIGARLKNITTSQALSAIVDSLEF